MSENSMEALLIKMMEQNEASNKLLSDIAKEREKTNRINKALPWIVCGIISLALCATFLVMHFKTLNFFSQYEFSYEEVTVDQDTAEGGGNNVYFPGENAQYNETPKKE